MAISSVSKPGLQTPSRPSKQKRITSKIIGPKQHEPLGEPRHPLTHEQARRYEWDDHDQTFTAKSVSTGPAKSQDHAALGDRRDKADEDDKVITSEDQKVGNGEARIN